MNSKEMKLQTALGVAHPPQLYLAILLLTPPYQDYVK